MVRAHVVCVHTCVGGIFFILRSFRFFMFSDEFHFGLLHHNFFFLSPVLSCSSGPRLFYAWFPFEWVLCSSGLHRISILFFVLLRWAVFIIVIIVESKVVIFHFPYATEWDLRCGAVRWACVYFSHCEKFKVISLTISLCREKSWRWAGARVKPSVTYKQKHCALRRLYSTRLTFNEMSNDSSGNSFHFANWNLYVCCVYTTATNEECLSVPCLNR